MNVMPRTGSRSGLALTVLLPWLVAATSLVVAAASWIAPSRTAPPPTRSSVEEEREARTLRLALRTAQSENAALRKELDRLLSSQRSSGSARTEETEQQGRSSRNGGGASAAAKSDEDLRDLANRVKEGVSRAAVGDQAGAEQAAMAIFETLKQGPEAFPALREAYLSTADPKARMMMIPSLVFSGRADARDFLISELQQETDPELRRALLQQTAKFATPEVAPAVKDTFVQALREEQDPVTRQAAIRGLRYARGKNVQEALLSAASDGSEEVRLAAIEALASRPGARSSLRNLIQSDPSAQVRDIGECHLLLSGR